MAGDRPTFEVLGVSPEIEAALQAAGFVIVPVVPTAGMIEEAYYSAHDEQAGAVWRDMIQAWGKSNSGNSGPDKA